MYTNKESNKDKENNKDKWWTGRLELLHIIKFICYFTYFNRIRDEITANNTNNEVANYIQSLYTQSEAISNAMSTFHTDCTYRFIHKYFHLSTMLLFCRRLRLELGFFFSIWHKNVRYMAFRKIISFHF